MLRKLHNISRGKPVLMSEFGFRARDSGLPNDKNTGPLLMTQSERAASFRRYIQTLVGLPFVVGYHMFMWADEPAGGQLFGANSNFGLVHLSDDPYVSRLGQHISCHILNSPLILDLLSHCIGRSRYEVLTDAFTDINALVEQWHLSGPTPPTPAPPAQACTTIAGMVCHQGKYCVQSESPTRWAYNGPDELDGCMQHCQRLNCTCMMHKAADRPPLHPACRIMQLPVTGLNTSEFGYSSWVSSHSKFIRRV